MLDIQKLNVLGTSTVYLVFNIYICFNICIISFRINTECSKEKNDSKDLSSPKLKEKNAKQVHQKTPSIESKKSTTETSNDPKTPNSSESDKKKDKDKDGKKDEKKTSRKSMSVSPDRTRHVHLLHDGM